MFSPNHSNAVFIIASVTGVLAFALLITKKVIKPIDEFSEATSEIKDLTDQIKGLRAAFELFKTLLAL